MSELAAGVRLQKLLAQAGVASRRTCEELISGGRVEVDGQVVTRLGSRVDPATAVIRVDGSRLPPASPHRYLALNKPAGVVSAMSDPHGRRCLSDLVPANGERLFHVGRLDADTEGLLLLTNDGELAHRIAHPSFEMSKTYIAEVAGPLRRGLGRQLRLGVDLADGPVTVDGFTVLDPGGRRALVQLELHEGRNRIVRRLLEQVGHPVQRLCRTAIGPVTLGTLASGAVRELTSAELGALLDGAGL